MVHVLARHGEELEDGGLEAGLGDDEQVDESHDDLLVALLRPLVASEVVLCLAEGLEDADVFGEHELEVL